MNSEITISDDNYSDSDNALPDSPIKNPFSTPLKNVQVDYPYIQASAKKFTKMVDAPAEEPEKAQKSYNSPPCTSPYLSQGTLIHHVSNPMVNWMW